MNKPISSRLAHLARQSLLATAALMAGASAFASDQDITTLVESLPAIQQLSTPTQTAYVRYRVTLTPYALVNNETFEPVYFSATTAVLQGSSGDSPEPGQFATFAAQPLPDGCVLASSTTVNCTFTPGLSSPFSSPYATAASPPKVFTLLVKTPSAGGRIKFSSETRWFESVSNHVCGSAPVTPFPFASSPLLEPCYESESEKFTFTPLTLPDPTVVDTFVPVAGGTVTTGATQGAATCVDGNKFVTIVKVPEPAQVGVNLNRVVVVDDDVPLNTLFFSRIQIPSATSSTPQLFGKDTRWYDPDAKNKLVVNTLRRDKCTIGSGTGSLKDGLLILKEKIFYKPDIPYPDAPELTPVYKQLLLCLVTSGPYPGQPCIVYAQVYTRFNLPNVPNKMDYLGDHEWVIFSNENGRIALPTN